jgi:hypothetical protein
MRQALDSRKRIEAEGKAPGCALEKPARRKPPAPRQENQSFEQTG